MSRRGFQFFIAGIWLAAGAILVGCGSHSACLGAAVFYLGIALLLKPEGSR